MFDIKIVILILLLIAFNALYYFSKFKSCQKLIKRISNINETDPSQVESLVFYKAELGHLAGGTPFADKTLYKEFELNSGMPVIQQSTVFNEFPYHDTIRSAKLMLDEASGYYFIKMKQSFSLFYWIRYLVFLPTRIISYLGYKGTGVYPKFLNIIYWVSVVIWWFFSPKIEESRNSLLNLFITWINK